MSTNLLDSAPPEIQKLMISMWADIQRGDHERQITRAKADPVGNKLTRAFDGGARMSWRYYNAGKDGRGRKVYFCWSTERNAAGYFLGWRQVTNKDGSGKRDMWTANRTRNRVKETAKNRTNAFREKRQAEPSN
jgi:hypothetical protein